MRIDPRAKMLPEVVVKATPIKRYKEATARLYPKGEITVSKLDSLRKAGFDKVIGEPIKKAGEVDMFGPVASDRIKKLMRKK